MSNSSLRQEQRPTLQQFPELVGTSRQATRMVKFAELLGRNSHTVLLQGEPGVGKGLMARYIHSVGRQDKPFVTVECGGMTEDLLNSELFGHTAGAFTDAKGLKFGLFEVAEDGTVFLDEVENMTHALQIRLLRVLQDKNFRRVGGISDIPLRARVIAATNTSLENAVRQGGMRADLFHRLKRFPFEVVPLRSRKEDIPVFAEYFRLQTEGGESKHFSSGAMVAMSAYDWPANVRELEDAVVRGVVFSQDDEIQTEDLQLTGDVSWWPPELELNRSIESEPLPTLKEHQRLYIAKVLRRTGGNVAKAGQILGIGRNTLYRIIKKFKN